MSLLDLVNLTNLTNRLRSFFHLTLSAGPVRIAFAITNRGILFGAANGDRKWLLAIARL